MTVVTVLVFSATLIAAVVPPPLLLITGEASLTGVTLMAMAWVSVLPAPSSACTMTS